MSAYTVSVEAMQNNVLHTGAKVNDIAHADYRNSHYQEMEIKKQAAIAKGWGLTPEEYSQYLHYINETPDAFAYDKSTTNPLWVLAAHTHDKNKYDRYIKQAVLIEHDETARMLRVEHDFYQMAHQLYPQEKPVMRKHQAGEGFRSGDVIQLYCDIQSSACKDTLTSLTRAVLHTSRIRLDFFALGNVNKHAIVAFVKSCHVAPQAVQSQRITLNFGDTQFARLKNITHKDINTPYVVIRRQGKVIPVNMGGTS